MLELTIKQAIQKPEAFIYIWADEAKFLRYIDAKHAKIIRGKKANQNKLLELSAEKYGTTKQAYTDAIRQALIDAYGLTPAQILVKLANGDTVAGKNWSEGVYGVGKVSNTFSGSSVSVDPASGKILNNGVEVEGQTAIFNKKGVSCYSAVVDGKTYTSNYRAASKQFVASQVVDSEGNVVNASGISITSADSADFWEMIIAACEKVINWLISLFGGDKSNTELISVGNTAANQRQDGFTTGTNEAGFGWVGTAVLATVLVGGVLYGERGKKTKK